MIFFFLDNIFILGEYFFYYCNYFIFYFILFYLAKNNVIVPLKESYQKYIREKDQLNQAIIEKKRIIQQIKENHIQDKKQLSIYKKHVLFYINWKVAQNEKQNQKRNDREIHQLKKQQESLIFIKKNILLEETKIFFDKTLIKKCSLYDDNDFVSHLLHFKSK